MRIFENAISESEETELLMEMFAGREGFTYEQFCTMVISGDSTRRKKSNFMPALQRDETVLKMSKVSKLKRRDELARQRKQKKVAWMQKMYEQARNEQRGEQEAEGGGEGGDFEDDDVDALLRWSDALDFDAYHQDWLSAATSARPTWREPVVPDLE